MGKYMQFAEEYAPEFMLGRDRDPMIIEGKVRHVTLGSRTSVASPMFLGGVALWFLAVFSIGVIVLG